MSDDIFVLFQDTGWEKYHEPVGIAVRTLRAAEEFKNLNPIKNSYCCIKLLDRYIPDNPPNNLNILPPNQPPQYIAGYEDQPLDPIFP